MKQRLLQTATPLSGAPLQNVKRHLHAVDDVQVVAGPDYALEKQV